MDRRELFSTLDKLVCNVAAGWVPVQLPKSFSAAKAGSKVFNNTEIEFRDMHDFKRASGYVYVRGATDTRDIAATDDVYELTVTRPSVVYGIVYDSGLVPPEVTSGKLGAVMLKRFDSSTMKIKGCN